MIAAERPLSWPGFWTFEALAPPAFAPSVAPAAALAPAAVPADAPREATSGPRASVAARGRSGLGDIRARPAEAYGKASR